MIEKQCMETTKRELILEASGKSKEEVYANIFTKLRKQIYNEVSGVVLHMEPLEVYELSENKEEYTEKFLWLFMPRQKAKYTIKAKVVVLIKYIQNQD